jgi:arylamine N-acetyltransferase
VHGGAGFEFLLQPRATEEFEARCDWFQVAPESPFVRTAVCHRLQPDYSILSLRGAVLTTINEDGKSQCVTESVHDYSEALTKSFGLRLSPAEILHLWEKVWPAHVAWVQAGA